MTRRLLVLLAAISLVGVALPESGWAHPGHAPIARAAHEATAPRAVSVASSVTHQPAVCLGDPHPAPRHHMPPRVAFVVGALMVLAALPDRRRTLALALAL